MELLARTKGHPRDLASASKCAGRITVFLLSSPTSFRTRLTVLMLKLCKQNHTLFVPNKQACLTYTPYSVDSDQLSSLQRKSDGSGGWSG